MWSPPLLIYTDASLQGWVPSVRPGDKTGGQWSVNEQTLHINILELKACQLALLSFCKELSNTHLQVFMDNTTNVSYINKFGGKSSELITLACEIWLWCLERSIHISTAHCNCSSWISKGRMTVAIILDSYESYVVELGFELKTPPPPWICSQTCWRLRYGNRLIRNEGESIFRVNR